MSTGKSIHALMDANLVLFREGRAMIIVRYEIINGMAIYVDWTEVRNED